MGRYTFIMAPGSETSFASAVGIPLAMDMDNDYKNDNDNFFGELGNFLSLGHSGDCRQPMEETDFASPKALPLKAGESVFSICYDQKYQRDNSRAQANDDMWDLASQMDIASEWTDPESSLMTPLRPEPTSAERQAKCEVDKHSTPCVNTRDFTVFDLKNTVLPAGFAMTPPMPTHPAPALSQQCNLTVLIGETYRSLHNGQAIIRSNSAESLSSQPYSQTHPRIKHTHTLKRARSKDCTTALPKSYSQVTDLSWGSVTSAQTAAAPATKRTKGTGHKYICGYCSKVKTSASACSDGRVRIRCECGGQYQDGKARMHATWSPLDPQAVAKAANSQPNVKKEVKHNVVTSAVVKQNGAHGLPKPGGWIFVDEAAAMNAPRQNMMQQQQIMQSPQQQMMPQQILHVIC